MVELQLCYLDGKWYNIGRFESVTSAYHFWRTKLATFGEKLYYLKIAHRPLKSVTNEKVMRMIFDNVAAENIRLVDI